MKNHKTRLAFAAAIGLMFLFITRVQAQDEAPARNHHRNNYHFEVGGMKIEEIGNGDTVVVYINKPRRDHGGCGTNFSTFPWGCKKQRFNGHWAGIDFGWNGYLTPDFNMDFKGPDQFLNFNAARSLMVNLNPFELNLNICHKKFGLVSGLGFQLSNYYFNGNYTLEAQNGHLEANRLYNGQDNLVPMEVNKLFVSYLTVPILFEFQTNAHHKINSFHVSAGVIGGVKLCSYQKQYLTTYDQTLYLKDPSGYVVGTITPDKPKVRYHDSYYLNPFKADVAFRIGWSYLNFYATYSLTSMFQANKGPEVYPYTVGITLLGW
jgi:hypothetical protein